MNRITIKISELEELLGSTPPEFPKYVTQILNLANQNSQGTRPKVVGQMSELIQEYPGDNINDWMNWYIDRRPDGIEKASERIFTMVQNLKEAIDKIDIQMIKAWVTDLVIVKTYIGLRFQEAIIKKIAAVSNLNYRLATQDEEAKGIDGWIGSKPVSIKPDTYDVKRALPEQLQGTLIVYKKTKNGLTLTIHD